jgi:hypothetical protein
MRGIRQEIAVTEQLAKYKVNYKRFDEAFEAVSHYLCNFPELFPLAEGTPLRRLKLNEFPGIPPLSIFFIFDDDYVYLISAEIIDADE